MTRTCVRPLVLSFSPSFTLSLFRFISLSPSLSLRHPPVRFFLPRTRDARLFIVLYTRRASFAAIARAHTVRDYLVRASMRTFFFAN